MQVKSRPLWSVFIAIAIVSCLPSQVQAQAPSAVPAPDASWQKLQRADTRIRACHVVWKRIDWVNAMPQSDPEQQEARTLDWAKRKGLTAEQSDRYAQLARREALRDKQGRTYTALLEFVRVENRVLCEISYPKPDHRAIEYYDGTNALFGWTQVNGKKVGPNANLVRDPEEILSHSAGREQIARFLLGIPLTQGFSAANPAYTQRNTRLRASEGKVALERTDAPASEVPSDLIVSPQHWRPTAYQAYQTNFAVKDQKVVSVVKGKTLIDISATEFKQYPSGIWFPSRVTLVTPSSTVEYSLVKASFNDEVDPAGLQLPTGIRIADARFGHGDNRAVYTSKDGQILSDAQVKKMLGEKSKEKENAPRTPKAQAVKPASSTSTPLLPLTGLLCIAFGAVLWTKSRDQ